MISPWAIGGVLAAALLFGGANAQGSRGDAIAILVSIPLLAWAVRHHIAHRDGQWGALALAAVTLLLPLLQIVAWPSGRPPNPAVHAVWQVDWVRVFGVVPPATWSLAPDATLRTLYAFIPPLAVFLGVLTLDVRGRHTLHSLLVALIACCAVWGILQAILGPSIVATWHAPPVGDQARGFFANRNHFATLMLFGIALSAAGLIGVIRRMVGDVEMARHGPKVILWAMLLLLHLVALMLSVSRAGVVLGGMMLVALLALTLFGIGRDSRGTRRWFASLAVCGCVVAVQMGLWGVLERFEADPFDDARVYVQRITLDAAADAQPWGTGFGTFRRVYEQREPLDTVLDAYVNRAHNDWLEFYLEAGKPGVVLIALWLGWWLLRLAHGARAAAPTPAPGDTGLRALRAGATFALIALAVHSLVDFPMRTLAIATVAGALLALSVRPVHALAACSETPGEGAARMPRSRIDRASA